MSSDFSSTKVDGFVVNSYTVIFRGRYGVTISGEDVVEMTRLAIERMPGDFGIISDRVFEFDMDPISFYREVNAIPQLKVIAILSHRKMTASIADIELELSEKPIGVFDSLDAAQQWVDTHLKPA